MTRLRELAAREEGATQLVALYDQRDGSALRCYGKPGALVLEGSLQIGGEPVRFVARPEEGAVPVRMKPDQVNPELELSSDELFTGE